MRIHVMTATDADIREAIRYAERESGHPVRAIRFAPYNSRTHTRAVDVVLSGSARHRSQADRTEFAATYDEWGWFLGSLYSFDPDVKCGNVYADSEDFRRKTHGKFTVGRVYGKPNDVEFDHVFRITNGGMVTDAPSGIYAPSSTDGELDSDDWEYWSDGYSGQYGYRGPIMHPSEFIGGRIERDLVASPGIYAVVADESSGTDAEDIPDDFPVRPVPWSDGPNIATCGTCSLSWDDGKSTGMTPVPSGRCPFESFHSDAPNGWAIVRYRHDGPVSRSGWSGGYNTDYAGAFPNE